VWFSCDILAKAALNYRVVELSHELQPEEGFTIISFHPGLVRTGMVFELLADTPKELSDQMLPQSISPEESAEAVYKNAISGAKQETHKGKFFNYDGTELTW
jgi:NAD(P)-dependent dehydrogenase (short-subunit alcohol dehydrogenase family)